MRLAFAVLAALCTVVAAGCRSNAPSGPTLDLPVTEASASCGPTDGPAVQLRFATTSGDAHVPPVAWVTVFRPRSELARRSFALGGGQGGAALQLSDGGELVTAVEGLLVVRRVAANGTIDGQVWVRFTDGTRIAQGFSAPWRERDPRCG